MEQMVIPNPQYPLFCSGPPSHWAVGMEKALSGQLAGWGVLSRAGGVPDEGLGEDPAPARGPSPAPPAQRPSARGCANLTLVLDNWKFAITSQLRNLLMSDHHTVLPDYGR